MVQESLNPMEPGGNEKISLNQSIDEERFT